MLNSENLASGRAPTYEGEARKQSHPEKVKSFALGFRAGGRR